MVITEYEHWLVVRQSRRRRIYRVTLVATVSRTLRTPLGARRTRRVVSCNYGGFISGACVSPRGVYAARVARQRGMGIPGDHVNRVETYQAPAGRIRRQQSIIATQTGRTLHRPQLLPGHAGTHTHWRERGQALWVTGVSNRFGGGVLSDTYPNVSHMYPAWILGVSCCFSHDSSRDICIRKNSICILESYQGKCNPPLRYIQDTFKIHSRYHAFILACISDTNTGYIHVTCWINMGYIGLHFKIRSTRRLPVPGPAAVVAARAGSAAGEGVRLLWRCGLS